MKALRELRNYCEELAATGPRIDLSEPIMLRVRQTLEHRSYRQSFQHLTLMCHWVVHASLHDSKLIYRWLTKTNQAVFRAPNNVELTRVGKTILDLDGLREELRGFLQREELPTLLVESNHVWYCFLQGLLAAIHEKPIGIAETVQPTKKSQELADAYLAENAPSDELGKWRGCVRSLEIFVQDGRFKVRLHTTGHVQYAFTIAATNPYMEFEASGQKTTDWAETVDVRLRPLA